MTVLLLTVVVYLPALGNGFTNWDDDKYVVDNVSIRSLSTGAVASQFGAFVEGNYHPLTMLSLAANYAIGGLNPLGYHLTNLALHVLNTALVFWLAMLSLAE